MVVVPLVSFVAPVLHGRRNFTSIGEYFAVVLAVRMLSFFGVLGRATCCKRGLVWTLVNPLPFSSTLAVLLAQRLVRAPHHPKHLAPLTTQRSKQRSKTDGMPLPSWSSRCKPSTRYDISPALPYVEKGYPGGEISRDSARLYLLLALYVFLISTSKEEGRQASLLPSRALLLLGFLPVSGRNLFSTSQVDNLHTSQGRCSKIEGGAGCGVGGAFGGVGSGLVDGLSWRIVMCGGLCPPAQGKEVLGPR